MCMNHPNMLLEAILGFTQILGAIYFWRMMISPLPYVRTGAHRRGGEMRREILFFPSFTRTKVKEEGHGRVGGRWQR